LKKNKKKRHVGNGKKKTCGELKKWKNNKKYVKKVTLLSFRVLINILVICHVHLIARFVGMMN
jgi:hypothetical protein